MACEQCETAFKRKGNGTGMYDQWGMKALSDEDGYAVLCRACAAYELFLAKTKADWLASYREENAVKED